MKVLVTGGAGYVGSHVCKALAQRGHGVTVIDDLRTGHADAVRWGRLIQADIGSHGAFARALDEVEPGAVVHMAGSCYVGESVLNPDMYHLNNTVASGVMLDAIRAAGVRRLVFSSSCAVYGVPASLPIRETTPRQPISPYGRSKVDIEDRIEREVWAGTFAAVSLRYFNAAGADPDSEIGERHDPETHLIPLTLEAASGRRRLQVFGRDHPTPDGTCIRDFVHVSDLADAHVLALEHLARGGASGAMNLGTGTGHSVLQVVGACERASGCKVPIEFAPRRVGDPPILVADATLATATLGWTPRFRDLDAIVQTAWRWHVRRT